MTEPTGYRRPPCRRLSGTSTAGPCPRLSRRHHDPPRSIPTMSERPEQSNTLQSGRKAESKNRSNRVSKGSIVNLSEYVPKKAHGARRTKTRETSLTSGPTSIQQREKAASPAHLSEKSRRFRKSRIEIDVTDGLDFARW